MQIERAIDGVRVPRARLASAVLLVLRQERRPGRVNVVIVGDEQMQRLNRRYRKRDKPTDVLSFPLDDDSELGGTGSLIGEVYCNHDHCRRWQREHGGTIADELQRLAVHGCLHLLGYDHHTRADRLAMSRAEDRYLRSVGLITKRMSAADD